MKKFIAKILILGSILSSLVATPVQAERLWSSGAELCSATANVDWTTISVVTNISSGQRTGDCAWGLSPSAQSATARIQAVVAADADEVYARAYVYVNSMPAADECIFYLSDNTVGGEGCVLLQADGDVGLWQNGLTDNTWINISTGAWYRIELYNEFNGTGWAYTVRVDGVEAATQTVATPGTGGAIFIGIGTPTSPWTGTGSGTYDIYIDDISINDTTGSNQNSWAGAGALQYMWVDSDGSIQQGTRQGADSGSNFGQVDEVGTPNNATDYWRIETDNSPFDVGFESAASAGIDSYDTISVVQSGLRLASDTGTATYGWVQALTSNNWANTATGTAETSNTTTWFTHEDDVPRRPELTSYTDPATGSAWTTSGLDSIQQRVYVTDATPDMRVTQMFFIVDYVDGSPPAGGGGAAFPIIFIESD